MSRKILTFKSGCSHKRVKRNWPFGRKSKPRKHCKDCGEILK